MKKIMRDGVGQNYIFYLILNVLSDAGSIEVIPDPSQTYNGTENETMEVLCRIERAMPIPTIHLYEVLENGPSEIHKGLIYIIPAHFIEES